MEISDLVNKMKLVNYRFDEKENIIFPRENNAHQVTELVNIYLELDKNNINYSIDQNYTFQISNTK